jgi:transcriptional regulator with XRE-family HTH domain
MLSRLRLHRERQALTQLDLAQKAGITPTTISLLERGRTEARPPTVRKLAKALGVKPQDLMGPAEE